MKGLLIKDFIVTKKYFRTILLFLLFFGAMAYFNEDASYFGGIVVMMCAMSGISSFSYDAQVKWDQLALSAPVSRKELVRCKYLLSAGLSLFGLVVSLVVTCLILLLKGQPIGLEVFGSSLLLVCAALLFLSILLPLIYKFGIEKGRVMIFAVVGILTASIILLGGYFAKGFAPTEQMLIAVLIAAPIIILLLFALSYVISCKIVQNKDF